MGSTPCLPMSLQVPHILSLILFLMPLITSTLLYASICTFPSYFLTGNTILGVVICMFSQFLGNPTLQGGEGQAKCITNYYPDVARFSHLLHCLQVSQLVLLHQSSQPPPSASQHRSCIPPIAIKSVPPQIGLNCR